MDSEFSTGQVFDGSPIHILPARNSETNAAEATSA